MQVIYITNRFTAFFLAICLCFVSSSQAQVVEKAEVTSKKSRLQESVLKVAGDNALAHGSLGFYALKVNSGEVIAANNPNQSLIPASTMKAVTTAAALKNFGSKHRFSTFIAHDGEIDAEGNLNGNLYIIGGGDPTIGSEFFYDKKSKLSFLNDWQNAVSAAGIKTVKGSIIADDRIFSGESVPEGWAWGDMGNYYGAGPSGLNIFDNTYEIEFSTGRAGEKAKVKRINPTIPYLELVNEVKGAETTGDNSCIYGSPNSLQRIIRGTIPSNKLSFIVKGSIPDPPLLAAVTFEAHLRSQGIEVSGGALTISKAVLQPSPIKNILEFKSPPLDSIVYWINIKSLNPYAEILLNHIGLQKLKSGDTNSGAKALLDFWSSQGIDTKGMFITDGSGLSRSNGVTTKQLAEIMQKMAQSEEFDAFYSSLPIAGRTGSIAGSCRGTAAENNLRAKSGYLNRVRSYTGYVYNKKGEMVAFAMIMNNYTCTASEAKAKLEKLMVALAESE
jgi:serine-type D-Ala-D-Ala carboxypeptidase/endopeptidase (penicillin-binding protein 4)